MFSRAMMIQGAFEQNPRTQEEGKTHLFGTDHLVNDNSAVWSYLGCLDAFKDCLLVDPKQSIED